MTRSLARSLPVEVLPAPNTSGKGQETNLDYVTPAKKQRITRSASKAVLTVNCTRSEDDFTDDTRSEINGEDDDDVYWEDDDTGPHDNDDDDDEDVDDNANKPPAEDDSDEGSEFDPVSDDDSDDELGLDCDDDEDLAAIDVANSRSSVPKAGSSEAGPSGRQTRSARQVSTPIEGTALEFLHTKLTNKE
jgi:hypothetical protein